MKLWKIISKNFKLLLRAKSSAFVVILGPLLIILLVGLAFNNSSTYDISVGIYSKEYNNLTNSFINPLENENYRIIYYDTNVSCIDAIKQGAIHTCIVFPENFSIQSDRTANIDFFVDYTRVNLARVVIDAVSGNIDIQTEQLSVGLTENILGVLDNTKTGILADIDTLEDIKTNVDSISANANSIKGSVDSIDLSISVPSTSSLTSQIDTIISKGKGIKSDAAAVSDSGYDLIAHVTNNSYVDDFKDDLDELNSTIDNVNYTYYENRTDELIASLLESLNSIEDTLDDAAAEKTNIKSSIDSLRSSLSSLQTDLDDVRASQQQLVDSINALGDNSAETIVNPVSTNINPVTPENTRLSYLLPDLFVLIIMFIGILLASTLIIIEKKSKAFFRNFTTPTSPGYFMATTFLTGFFTVLVQIVLILGIVFYFLRGPLFDNFFLTLIILCISISLFVLIGMAIGYLFYTQEGAMVASICLGSVFLFLSNLVLPLESMAPTIQVIARYNPFVMSSDLLRKSLLFNATFSSVVKPLIILISVVVGLFFIIALVQKLSNIRFFKKPPHIKDKPVQTEKFRMLGRELKDKEDLLVALKDMSDDYFKSQILGKKRIFVKGLRLVISDTKLRVKIKTKRTRKRMIKTIENYKKNKKKKK